jgi:hypothetical protein
VFAQCMCGDTLTALWRRAVLPVVPYRNEPKV